MGYYGTDTTCQLCEQNHPSRAHALACAEVTWRGHVPSEVSSIPDTLPADFTLARIPAWNFDVSRSGLHA